MTLPVHIFTDANLQREFQCPICMCCISQCYSTKCGHLFCSQCIMTILSPHSCSDSSTDEEHPHNMHRPRQFGQCPVCNRLLQIGDIFPAPYMDQKIAQQIIRCLYFHKGCVWTGTLSDLKRKDGHLKHCGYTLYACKYCKEKIVRNQMVRHQNEECKSNYMLCPYYIYGCAFECRIREMEKHCKVNELKHVKLKLDYLENQLFVPEIIKLHGMTGFNNQYIESNGKYYLNNRQHKHKHKHQVNALQPAKYTKSGGYTLEFNQTECIWHLRSMYYGLVAYGMPRKIHEMNETVKQLSHYMNSNCVWSVYFKRGEKNSLVLDENVVIESIPLSDGMMKFRLSDDMETDTEEINGEFEPNMNVMNAQYDGEGIVAHKQNNNQEPPSWYNIIFGGESFAMNKKKNVTAKRLELVGVVVLAGIVVYYVWSKFAKSHPVALIDVLHLKRKTGILIPKTFVK
eukprot:541765_1